MLEFGPVIILEGTAQNTDIFKTPAKNFGVLTMLFFSRFFKYKKSGDLRGTFWSFKGPGRGKRAKCGLFGPICPPEKDLFWGATSINLRLTF